MQSITTRKSKIYLLLFLLGLVILGYLLASTAAHDEVPAGASNSGNTSGVNRGTPIEKTAAP